MAKPTAEELAVLTPEELEALEDDTIVDEGETDPTTGVEAVIPDDANALIIEGEANKPAPAADPAAAAAAAATPAAPAPAAPAAPATVPAPAPAAPPARDFAGEINGLLGQQTSLAEKFDAGDLSAAEYETQRQQLEAKLFDARADARDARRADEDVQTSFYQRDVPEFLTAHPQYAEGTARFHALNGHVLALQNEAIARAGGDERAQFNKTFLQQAFEKVEKELGATQRAAAPAAGIRELPPNLSAAPAAAGDDDITTNSRWAALDRLAESDPERHEAELAKLSEADQTAYLAAQ